MESPSSKPKPLPLSGVQEVDAARPLSRMGAGTPGIAIPPSRTPRPTISRPPSPAASVSAPKPPPPQQPQDNRPLNVTDALSYLDAVKVQFQEKPEVYNKFLDIMKDFKSQVIDTPGVIQRVSRLFHGNPYLIQGFNTFLPAGYRIDISGDPLDPNTIIVTTPSGITTQSTNAISQLPATPTTRPTDAAGSSTAATAPIQFQTQPSLLPTLPAPPLPSSRSMTPQAFHMGPTQAPIPIPLTPQPLGLESQFSPSPALQNTQTTAAASVLGNLNNKSPVKEQQPPGEFNHAIQYLNKIKARYADDSNRDTYKQFLDILQTYQKEQKHVQDTQVYVQVQMLFRDAPDLLAEFKDFLPEAVPPGVNMLQLGGLAAPMNQAWPPDNQLLEKPSRKANPSVKRKKRILEKDPTPVPIPKAAPSRAKKPKLQHKPDTMSPTFSPYPLPPSPPQAPHTLLGAQPLQHHQHLEPQLSLASINPSNSPENKLLFFDRAKKALQNQQTYEEFLKLLTLFSKDVVDMRLLITCARSFLGEGELMAEFKDVIGWEPRLDNVENGPPGSIRTGPPEALSALPAEDGEGPSYRRLPESEVHLACSGRDELCRSVLNDEWVSHPTWASEEAGFVTHKKNSFEEAMNRSEEERHEYHVQLEALTRTISVLEPILNRIDEMNSEERAGFRLKADFGGQSKAMYHRVLKKVYGRDNGVEIIQALQECPSVAIPVVLARLKQKDEEWRRAHREWSRVWREVDAKNYYKSLDHQGISFKVNDKKNITSKHFVTGIEVIRSSHLAQQKERGIPSFARSSTAFHLEFKFEDTSVLQDSLKMVYSFLDRSTAHYSSQERRTTEKFLRSFIPLLCMFPAAEFNAACAPPDGQDDEAAHEDSTRNGRRSTGSAYSAHSGGIPADDLRQKLLRAVQERSSNREHASSSGSRAATPFSSSEENWVEEGTSPDVPSDLESTGRPFFANTTFYTFIRLMQLLYSRLLVCKEEGQRLADRKHSDLLSNPVAVELGLEDPNGPSTVLGSMKFNGNEKLNVVYLYLLDACERLFAGEMDQGTFEEHMRWFFGTKAYHLFTLDKLIIALVKQIQTIISDSKCQELLELLQSAQVSDTITKEDVIRYRREAEMHVQDEHLYRVLWHPESKALRIQLMGSGDPSIESVNSRRQRWREYVRTFAMQLPTEWVPPQEPSAHVFLRRTRIETIPSTVEGKLSLRITLPTYQMRYENGTEDLVWRKARHSDSLIERARIQDQERRKILAKLS